MTHLDRRLTTLALALVAAAPAIAVADQLHVPNQHATLQAAVTAASPGDVILLKEGTYAGGDGVATLSAKHDLIVRGLGDVVIDAAGANVGIEIVNSLGVRVEGLRIRNAAVHGIEVVGSRGVLIDECEVRQSGAAGIDVTTSASVVVRECDVRKTGDTCISLDAEASVIAECKVKSANGTGLALLGRGSTAIDNVVLDFKNTGILLAGTGNRAIANDVKTNTQQGMVVEGSDHLIEGNTLRAVIYVKADDSVLRDNEIKGSASGGMVLSASASGNSIVENRVSKATLHGFYIWGDDNTLIGNVTKKSGQYGLQFGSVATGNVRFSNKFDSVAP